MTTSHIFLKIPSFLYLLLAGYQVLGLWCLAPLSTIFKLYIVAFIFTGGGNQSTRRKPAAYQLMNHIIYIHFCI